MSDDKVIVEKKTKENYKSRALNWCFTINHWKIGHLSILTSLPWSYLLIGFEIGKKRRNPHIQGYIEFDKDKYPKPIYLTALIKLTGVNDIHWEVAKKDQKINYIYCTKDGAFIEMGEPRKTGVKSKFGMIIEDIHNGATKEHIMERYPDVYIRSKSNIDAMIMDEKKKIHEFDDFKPYAWQNNLIYELNQKPHNRKIIWYIDSIGNTGKTFLCKYLVYKNTDDAIYFTNGKSNDITHSYNGQTIVLFDFTRSIEGHINYSIIETLKNGIMFSGKYNSRQKIFSIPHVVCFSNFNPDPSTLSADRWDIRDISPPSSIPSRGVVLSSR